MSANLDQTAAANIQRRPYVRPILVKSVALTKILASVPPPS
jgi:hypothetical protein